MRRLKLRVASFTTPGIRTVFLLVTAVHPFDRRVVDVAEAGNLQSEAVHGYAGHDATIGVANGKPYRHAAGWMRYALTTFDDTEVTIACTFVGTDLDRDNVPRNYDVVVEDSLIVSRSFRAPADSTVVVNIVVPFAITRGKTNIAVVLRARGGPTPALREIRTIQDHNEDVLTQKPFGVTR